MSAFTLYSSRRTKVRDNWPAVMIRPLEGIKFVGQQTVDKPFRPGGPLR